LSTGTAVIRQPVNISNADLAEAKERLRGNLRVASRYVPEVDAYTTGELVDVVMAAIHRGDAKQGLKLQALLESAHVGTGHVRQKHFTPCLDELVELVTRMTSISVPMRSVRCEYLYVSYARTGRYRNSLATDRTPKVAPGLRFAGIAISLDDRHVPTSEIPFTTGTRHDYSSERVDPTEIARLERELGRRPNGPPAEHFEELLGIQRRAFARLEKAAAGTAGAALAVRGFSPLIVAESMPCGPAPKRALEGAFTYWPGRDQDLSDVLLGAGKRGVAHYGRRKLTGSDTATHAELIAEGFEPKLFGRSELDNEFANDVDWGVSWYWKKQAERVQVGEGSVRVDDWRVLGLADELDVAVALVRRHEHPWTTGCIKRTVLDTAPGLIKASSYRSDAAQRDFLRLGRAVLVGAERVGRIREAAG